MSHHSRTRRALIRNCDDTYGIRSVHSLLLTYIPSLDRRRAGPMIVSGMNDATPPEGPAPARSKDGYRVLARKYRPTTFAEVIGQDALVRTLTNALRSGRLAHAFILTGVRGIGKTTTARIIARALNCIGPDGTGGPTVTPCGVCRHCTAIAADRHVDVLEMDAASNTGVDDVREIIDGVRYAPAMARYKVYIIDEVHMLSRNAFNALLKTLEEPPPHAKFIFATTEIRKVPVTVLSRCQRFDLRRVDEGTLIRHYTAIVEKEGVAAEPEAVAMIARAADGSVRDGLSLLDQAIALGTREDGGAEVTALLVRDMLGLADRTAVIDLIEAAVRGQAAAALERLDELHRGGADPVVVLQDLLDVTHFLTRVSVVPALAESPAVPEAERTRGTALAQGLSMPVLQRMWQMLLKGLGEVQAAPMPAAALEMVVIRLVHAAGLPTPGEVIRRLESGAYGGSGGAAPGGGGGGGGGRGGNGAAQDMSAAGAGGARGGPLAAGPAAPRAEAAGAATGGAAMRQASMPEPAAAEASPAAPAPAAEPAPAGPVPMPADFRAMVALFAERADPSLHGQLYANVHPVRYQPGRVEFRPRESAPRALASQVMALLRDWTGERWVVTVSAEPGDPTLSQQDRAEQERARAEAEADPVVRAVLAAFPGATIKAVHDAVAAAPDAGAGDDAAEPEVAAAAPDPDEMGED